MQKGSKDSSIFVPLQSGGLEFVMNQPQKKKPNTPQKYGHARRILPIRKRIWQRVVIRWAVVLAIGVAFVICCIISGDAFRNYPQKQQLSWSLTVLVYVFVVWKSRVLPMTFSKGWVGVVKAKEVKKYTRIPQGLASFGADARKTMGTLAVACHWTVEKEDGETETLRFDTEEIWEGYFEIGERVRLYKNAKILVKAHPPKEDENLMCPLCGVMVVEPVCKKCGVDFTEKEADPSARVS